MDHGYPIWGICSLLERSCHQQDIWSGQWQSMSLCGILVSERPHWFFSPIIPCPSHILWGLKSISHIIKCPRNQNLLFLFFPSNTIVKERLLTVLGVGPFLVILGQLSQQFNTQVQRYNTQVQRYEVDHFLHAQWLTEPHPVILRC